MKYTHSDLMQLGLHSEAALFQQLGMSSGVAMKAKGNSLGQE